MKHGPAIFISYRRMHLEPVRRVQQCLEGAGFRCFLDVDDIDALESFPTSIREAIGRSHVFLAWWSADYGESGFCLQEFRLAWQHARRRSSDLARRIWIVNPEKGAGHVFAGELDSRNFLAPPLPGSEETWAAALRQRLQESNLILEGPLADEREMPAAPVLYGVPEKSREFTGRNPEMARIHSKLHPVRMADAASVAAVQTFGLPGVGKTEVAIAYAREYVAGYPGGIYWLNLAGWQLGGTAQEDAAEIAWLQAVEQTFRLQPEFLHRLTRDSQGKEQSARVVRERLAEVLGEKGAYLWVIDNLPDLSPLDVRARIVQFIRAPNSRGHTLVTTRDSRLLDGFAVEPLDRMSDVDAFRLLAQYRPRRAQDEAPVMRQLVAVVGAHTQALTLLGEHARNNPRGYADVLERLEAGVVGRIEQVSASLRDLLGARARGILATFALSIEPLAQGAREILSLASVCTPNLAIPDLLLAHVFGHRRADEFAVCLSVLLRSSLIQRRTAAAGEVLIHPLVAEATRLLLETDTRKLQERLAEGLLHRVALAHDIHVHPSMRADIEQARNLGMRLEDQGGVQLLLRVGQFERARGRFSRAHSAQTRALAVAVRVLLESHPDTLAAMSNLGCTLREQGDLRAARDLQERALSVARSALGEEHSIMPYLLNSLAMTLYSQGEWAGARTLHEKLLAMRSRCLGEEAPETVTVMNNLARTLRAQGDFNAARALHEKVLKIWTQRFGAEHRDTLTSMNNLANTLLDLGDLRAARRLHEKVQSISRRVLGDEHPDTLSSLNNLGNILREQGELREARALLESGFATRRRLFGAEHPSTLDSMNNLASVLYEQGELGSARSLYEQLVSIRQRVLGEEHPVTMISLGGLAVTLQMQGEVNAARVLFERVSSVNGRSLGEGHPATLRSMSSLASCLKLQGYLRAACLIEEQVLAQSRCHHGIDHPGTLVAINNLADTLRERGELRMAFNLLEYAWLNRKRVMGEDHFSTYSCAWNLLVTLIDLGNKQRAIRFLQSALVRLTERDPLDLCIELRTIRVQVSQLHSRASEQLPADSVTSTVWMAPLVVTRRGPARDRQRRRIIYRVNIFRLHDPRSFVRLHATRFSWRAINDRPEWISDRGSQESNWQWDRGWRSWMESGVGRMTMLLSAWWERGIMR